MGCLNKRLYYTLFLAPREQGEVTVTTADNVSGDNVSSDDPLLRLLPAESGAKHVALCVDAPTTTSPSSSTASTSKSSSLADSAWTEAAEEVAAMQRESARRVQARSEATWRIVAKAVVARRVFEAIRKKYQQRRIIAGIQNRQVELEFSVSVSMVLTQ